MKTLGILQQRLEINVWYQIDEWMEKREDGLGKPGVMIDCWDGSCTALQEDDDLGWWWRWKMIAENKYRKVNIGPHAHPLIGEPLTGEPLIGDLTNKQGKMKKKPSFIQFYS